MGFSLAEVMVAAGLIGIVALGAINLSSQMMTVQKRGKNFLSRNDFMSSFSRYLYSGNGCFNGTASTVDLPAWKYLGASGLSEGDKAENITITNFKATQNLASSLPRVQVGSDNLIKTSLEIAISLVQEGRTTNHFYTLPVLSLPSGEVKLCNESKDAAQVCNAMLGNYDSSTNSCIVSNSCLLKGTYKTLSCTPTHATGCSMDYGDNVANQYTGATSCPTGSIPSQTGIINWNHSVSCGKKCTITISNTATWFTCLECP
jgi:type II secretory pathway pseudopilin PulG